MPTTRRRSVRGRRVLTLDALNIPDILSFLSGWHPPETDFERGQSRWQTWEEFDEEYGLLRDEMLASEWAQSAQVRGRTIFAEERWQAQRKGEYVAND